MTGERRIWLVTNDASGSNEHTALEALLACFADNALRVAHRSVFPEQELPTAAVLDAAQIEWVAVFTGDGTVNTLLAELAGWGGAVLVLPGGTMNLLHRRLHGDRTSEETIAAAARGETVIRRPGIVRSRAGDAFADVLAGPGTSWGRVREAMRDQAVADLAASTVTAIEETLTGEMITCVEPPLGRREGYPLIDLTPHDDGIEVAAYGADNAAQYLEQAWALLKRNFREGPHEVLGRARTLRLVSTQGKPFGLLIDGEQAEATGEVEFSLATCEVDLLATRVDDF